jgi:glycosyltransferase involved in cell wall biosynthesis
MNSWVHVPTPLSTQESSHFVVVENLCAQHRASGGDSAVVVSDNREIQLGNAQLIPVDYTSHCPRQWFTRTEMRIDHAYGLLGRQRPYSSRIFLPAIEALVQKRPDVIFLHEEHHATPSLPLWAEALPESQLVLYAHIPFSRSYLRNELRRLLRVASGVVFVSRAQRDYALRALGRQLIPFGVVNNGVDTADFYPARRREDERCRLTYVGEIHPHKGLHLLIAAVHRARQLSDRSVLLRVVGNSRHYRAFGVSAYEEELHCRAAQLSLDIEWLGRLPHSSMPAIYRASDIVCVPSVGQETFGMVVLEAMACGAGVIASPAGGLRDAGGDAALYVDPTDEDGLAQAIADLADDTDRLCRLQARGIEHALRSDWGSRYEDLTVLIESFRLAA